MVEIRKLELFGAPKGWWEGSEERGSGGMLCSFYAFIQLNEVSVVSFNSSKLNEKAQQGSRAYPWGKNRVVVWKDTKRPQEEGDL